MEYEDLNIKESENGISIFVKVVPRASKNAVSGVREGALLVHLCAPPVEGKANQALATFLAEFLKIRKNLVTIKVGEKSRLKIISIAGISSSQLLDKLHCSKG